MPEASPSCHAPIACCAWFQIYGKNDVFDAERLIDLLGAFETFREASQSGMGNLHGSSAEFVLPTNSSRGSSNTSTSPASTSGREQQTPRQQQPRSGAWGDSPSLGPFPAPPFPLPAFASGLAAVPGLLALPLTAFLAGGGTGSNTNNMPPASGVRQDMLLVIWVAKCAVEGCQELRDSAKAMSAIGMLAPAESCVCFNADVPPSKYQAEMPSRLSRGKGHTLPTALESLTHNCIADNTLPAVMPHGPALT